MIPFAKRMSHRAYLKGASNWLDSFHFILNGRDQGHQQHPDVRRGVYELQARHAAGAVRLHRRAAVGGGGQQLPLPTARRYGAAILGVSFVALVQRALQGLVSEVAEHEPLGHFKYLFTNSLELARF